MLSIENLYFQSYKGRKILKNVSLYLKRGEWVGIIGGSGAGKTSIFYFLFQNFLTKKTGYYTGTLKCDSKIQPILQDPLSSFNPYIPMIDSLIEPLLHQGYNKQIATQKIKEFLPEFHLESIPLNKLPQYYSGGQLQRLSILRAILTKAGYLAMDEPVSGLDPISRNSVLDFLKKVQQKENLGILLISHDLESIIKTCNRVYVLKDGEVIEEGKLPDFPNEFSHPYTKEFFQPYSL